MIAEGQVKPAPTIQAQKRWTIKDVLEWSANYLKQKGSDTPRLDAELLMANTLGLNRVQLYTQYDRPLNQTERDGCRAQISRRANGEPVAYLVGKKSFYRYDFIVNPSVLIPRSDTELLVESALEHMKEAQSAGKSLRVLDIGTGSGCIAISLALEFEGAEVVALDSSAECLAVAKQNAELLEAKGNLSFLQADIFHDQTWNECGQFDFIVSNPPYIAASEAPNLQKSVISFEPETALFAADNGFAFYKTISKNAANRLKQGGRILFEVGFAQAEEVCKILTASGFVNLEIKQDLSGMNRVVIGSLLNPENDDGV